MNTNTGQLTKTLTKFYSELSYTSESEMTKKLEYIDWTKEQKVMDDFYEIELETGAIISPLIYSKSKWDNKHSMTPLFENIKKEGIRIK